MPPLPSRRTRLGLGLLVVAVLYLPVELFVAAAVDVPYDLVRGTVSELGVVTCGDLPGPMPAVCSPRNALMNAAFVAYGLLVIVGMTAARPVLRPGASGSVATGLWVITGLGSIATGLVPVDVAYDLHLLVSTPVFVAQPPALLLTAWALPRGHRVLAATGLVCGLAGAVATVLFLAGLGSGVDGLLERLVLWPATVWLGAAALVLRLRPPGGPAGLSPGRPAGSAGPAGPGRSPG